MHCPSEEHLKVAKRVVRYIKGTINYGIKFQKIQNLLFVGYFDSDSGGSLDDMKSILGYCFSLGMGIFSWCSKKQEIVAQSTAEAEFIAATTVVNQVLWLKKFLIDLNREEKGSMFVDNQTAITISHNLSFMGKPIILTLSCSS